MEQDSNDNGRMFWKLFNYIQVKDNGRMFWKLFNYIQVKDNGRMFWKLFNYIKVKDNGRMFCNVLVEELVLKKSEVHFIMITHKINIALSNWDLLKVVCTNCYLVILINYAPILIK